MLKCSRFLGFKRIAIALMVLLSLSVKAIAQSQDNKRDTTTHAAIAASPVPRAEDTQHEIYGTVTDEMGIPVVNASVYVSEDGILRGRTFTDFDGNYSVKLLRGGRYDLLFSFMGHKKLIARVIVADKTQVCSVILLHGEKTCAITVFIDRNTWGPPFLNPENPGGSITHRREMLPNGW